METIKYALLVLHGICIGIGFGMLICKYIYKDCLESWFETLHENHRLKQELVTLQKEQTLEGDEWKNG